MPLDYIEFSKKIKQKYPQYKDVDDMVLSQKMVEKYPEYKDQVVFKEVKKKSSTELSSPPKGKGITSAIVKTTTQKPSVSSGGKKVDIFTGLPGKEDNQYRVINNAWQRKEPNKDWSTVRDANAILYLNKYYKKNITPNEGFEGISSKLIDNEEGAVTNYLKNNYGHLGFKFEESGVGKDRVTVLTEDGTNSETFYLDNWTDDEDASEAIRMKAWLKENIKTSDRERYNKIQEQMAQIKDAGPKQKTDFTKDAFANKSAGLPADLSLDIKEQLKVKELEKQAMEYNRSRMNTLVKDINEAKKTSGKYDDEFTRARVAAVYGNKDEIAKQNSYISNNLEDIARANKYISNKVYQYEQEQTKLNQEIDANGGVMSPEMEEKQRSLEGMAEMIKAQSEDLKSSINTSKKDQNKINEMAGEYMLFKESKGTVGGGIVNNFLKGATNLARFSGLSRQGQEELIKLIGSDYTENEFTTSAERSDIEKVLFSLSNSIGAAVGGGGVATVPSFFAQSYYEMKDQMDDDPNFDSVPDLEKTLLASTYGIAIGALEKFGLDVIASKTPLGKSMSGTVNKILASTIKGLPKGAGAEVLEEAINKNIKTLIAKGAINVVGGSIVEGSTEFTQELVGGGIKKLYNTMKEKEMFKSPESLLSQAYESAWLGALGGAVMQTPVQAVNAIATGLSNKNTTMAEILEKAVTDSELRSMMTTSIKSKIVAGEINSEEGKKQLEAVNQAAGVFQKMPDTLTQEDKSTSFDLMIERSKIEKEIEGKDENLVAAQKARIADINNQLKTISEDAVQKQAAGEVPVQPGSEVSGEMAQGEPQAEPQIVTEEGQAVDQEEVVEPKVQIGGIIRGYESISDTDTVGDIRYEIPNENKGTVIVDGVDGNKYAVAFSRKGGDGENIFEQGASTPRPGYVSASIMINENATPEQIQEAQKEAERNLNLILPTIKKGNINKVAINDAIIKQQPKSVKEAEVFEFNDKRYELAGGSITDIETGNLVPIELATQIREEGTPIKVEPTAQEEVVEPTEEEGKKITKEEDVLKLDTKEENNLQKVLNALDKIEKDLDQFGKETLGINIPVATMRAIIKLAKTLVKTGITLQDAIIQAAEQKNVSKKDALNAIKFMSETINRPVKKVIVNEMTALRDQLKFESRAARESQQDLKRKQRELIVTVNKMKRSGTVTANQAAVLAKKITYLNVYNPVMVDRFLQYAERLFKNAEYQNILSEASKVRKSIKNFMKNNQANVTAMAKDFGKINPAMVEDIEQYLDNAKAVLNAVKRSKQDTDFPIKNAADIDVITKYTEDMLEKQEEQLKNEKLKEYQDLVDQGILTGDMTLKDINEIIKAIEEEGPKNKVKQETELRRFLNTRFEMYSTIVKNMLKTNVDPFTGDTVEISDKDKEVLKRLLKVNLDDMSIKNAYTIVESMDNFIVNGITDGLDGAISAYEGDIEAKNLLKEGVKADKIKGLLFGLSPVTGRAIYENFATLPVLFDSLFKGVKSGMKVMDSMGFNLLSRGFAKATNIYNNAINNYGETFSKSKPNGQQFNTSFNAYERGMLAYLKRTVPGNETAQKAEFKRRVELIKESIQSLREYGNEDQQKMANIYEEVYTKLGLDNADITIDQVQANVDPKNAEAVNWWIDQWSQHYSDLYDVSLDVYNTKLGKDINYTTDRYSRVDGERELVDEATGNIGAFALDLGLTSYKDKAGVLMESNKNFKTLDTGKKASTRFVNLDFDVSNASALRSALIDVNTASAVRKVDAFLNSRSYDKLFAEEKDAKLLKRRVQNYILRYKNKIAFSDPTLAELDKYLDMAASFGATRALGGPSQAVLQTVPVFLSTLTNAGAGNVDFKGLVSDTDFHTWLNNSGYAIANRGMETSTAIESANKYLDKVAETKGEKLFKGVMKLNEFWLKTFLSQPDVWIARNSWKAYYIQSLKEQKLYNGNIDWATHEINEQAADYAQHMVDRQQNVSDAAMMGDFMNSQQPVKKIVRKVVLPFANFIMNQKTRLYSDVRTLSSNISTKEDKIKSAKSLAGLAVEMSAYNAIGYALKLYVYDTIAAALTGGEEDEEEKEKNKQNRKKFVAQNLIKDVFSPLPVLDGITIQGLNFIADKIQDKTMSQDEINKAVEERNIYLESRGEEPMTAKEKEKFVKDFVDSQKMVFEEYSTKQWIDLGTATIAIDKARELYDMIDMSTTGKFKKEFNGNEVEKVILPDNMGDIKIAATLSTLYNLGLLPREFNSVATSMKKYIQKNAISQEQFEDYKEIKKEFGDVDGYKKELLKSKMKIDNVINEIRWVEENGGLTKEQSAEYNKLREVQGNVYIDDLKKLQKGIKAEKIYKRGN
jgi:hypothetical protein